MRLDTFLLADAVSTPPDGKLYIHGGGITSLTLPELPFVIPQLALLIRVQLEADELAERHAFELSFTDPTGANVVPQLRFVTDPEAPAERGEDEERFIQVAFAFGGLTLSRAGTHTITLLGDGQKLRQLKLPAVHIPATSSMTSSLNREERRRVEEGLRRSHHDEG
jgi:hypothetical protein